MAASSTRVSREKFRNTTPSFIWAMASSLIIIFVEGSAGTWMVMKSLAA